MPDQFAHLADSQRIADGKLVVWITTPFGEYISGLPKAVSVEPLRTLTLDELQASWCISKQCWQDTEDDMNANAIACKRFHGHPEEQYLADRHGERHAYHSACYGRLENRCIAIQAEMQWRLDHPDFDVNDPFRDE